MATTASTAARSETLSGFRGTMERVRVAWTYRFGLFLVAAFMVLLPLIYVAIVGLTAWGVYYHATEHWTIFQARGGGLGEVLVYFGPIVVGSILVLFMVKPFFAPRVEESPAFAISRQREPLLYEFLEKICSLVGAPFPREVVVDCQVNASASFRRGLWSFWGNDLRLTIGLPLVAGLDLRQFAGVLAHELGHFSQGTGMRLSYVIQRVNGWLVRAVYERDQWDQRLERWAKGIDIRIGVVFHLARFFVWLTRRILWVLMMAGHWISFFMTRQMEFDADRYAARLAGSSVFRASFLRIPLIDAAWQASTQALDRAWMERKLGDDFASLVRANLERIPPDEQEKIRQDRLERKAQWWDTHPPDRRRIERAEREEAPGVFTLERPATDLFRDFRALSREASLAFYRNALGSEVTQSNLVSTERLLSEEASTREELRSAARVLQHFPPVLVPSDLKESAPPADEGTEALRNRLRECRSRFAMQVDRLRSERKKIGDLFSRPDELWSAEAWLDAGVPIDTKSYRLSESSLSTVRAARQKAEEALEAWKRDLEPLRELLRDRFSSAFRLVEQDSALAALRSAWRATAEAMPRIRGIAQAVNDACMLLERVPKEGVDESYANAIRTRQDRMRKIMGLLRSDLERAVYPFEHAETGISIGLYLCGRAKSDSDEISDAAAAVTSYWALFDRILGKLARTVERAEAAAGLEPLPEPEPEPDNA